MPEIILHLTPNRFCALRSSVILVYTGLFSFCSRAQFWKVVRVWTSLAGALGVGTSCMSSVHSCRRAGRQPRTCHLYPAPLPGLPVDTGAHLSVKGGLIFQGNCLANHTLKVIVGFLSALSLHVTQKASVGETELRKLTLIMCHHGQPIMGRWERIAYFFPAL